MKYEFTKYQCSKRKKVGSSRGGFFEGFSLEDRVHYMIAPSMSFDKKLLNGIEGIEHYELRSFLGDFKS